MLDQHALNATRSDVFQAFGINQAILIKFVINEAKINANL